MTRSYACGVAVVLLLLLGGCGAPPQVIQGTVLSYDAAAQSLALTDEREPNREMTFSLAGADVGAEPRVGDMVRLAYRDRGGTLTVIRVMNLSRQEELQKK